MDKNIQYQIRVKGHLDDTWADWFEGLTFTNEANGEAVILGSLPDQAALQGILNRISSLGLTLISVNSINEENKDLVGQNKYEADNGESEMSE
jgi:hypothetical protein